MVNFPKKRMEHSLRWFESISPKMHSCRKRHSDIDKPDILPKKNVRRTPSTAFSICQETVREGKTQVSKMQFIMNGNKAPDPQILRSNMFKSQLIQEKEMDCYFQLLERDTTIKQFLEFDRCYVYADKYNLACVFAYFKRCNFEIKEYKRLNFFCCLYLVHDMEEDNEDYKYEIFPWALGCTWRKRVSSFLRRKENIWARMSYRAVVSLTCCREIMAIYPEHPIWNRTRLEHHGHTLRTYVKDKRSSILKGPFCPPSECIQCSTMRALETAKGARNIIMSNEQLSGNYQTEDRLLVENRDVKLEYSDYLQQSCVSTFSRHHQPEQTWLSQETYCSTPDYSRTGNSFIFAEE